MAKKLYDLAVKTGSYTDNQGQEKGRWLNVGSVMQGDDNGKFIMLHRTFNPAGVPDLKGHGGDSVLLSMFEPKQHQQQPQSRTAPPPSKQQNQDFNDYEDDIPFRGEAA